jgi:hypothetical protein
MNDEELLKLAEEDPQAVESISKALRQTIDFHNGRGAMLRSLRLDPQVKAIAYQLRNQR